jgi:hypothetical protein
VCCSGVKGERLSADFLFPSAFVLGAVVASVVHAVMMMSAVMPAVASVLPGDGGRGEQDGGHREDAHDLLHR